MRSDPRSMLLALALCALGTAVLAQNRGGGSGAPAGATPRTSDGKPDLSGVWARLAGEGAGRQEGGGGNANLDGTQETFAKYWTMAEKDIQLRRRAVENKPIYKPEHWALIRKTDWDYSRSKDMQTRCMPHMPRLGLPSKIIQTPNEVAFFYEGINRYRVIPTDGRPHDDVVKDGYLAWFGHSVGHWEGDTLVIDTIGVLDQGWLGPNGYVHSDETRVIERIRREGDTLRWNTTVEDPMLVQPWEMDPLTARLNPNQKGMLWETAPCVDHDLGGVVGVTNEGK